MKKSILLVKLLPNFKFSISFYHITQSFALSFVFPLIQGINVDITVSVSTFLFILVNLLRFSSIVVYIEQSSLSDNYKPSVLENICKFCRYMCERENL